MVARCTLLGKRVPAQLKLFLTTVAIVDDMGAVAIIAIAYSKGLDIGALLAAAGMLAVMWALGRRGVTALTPYLLCFALLWWLVLLSGVHATVAGVLAAALIPVGADEKTSPLHRLEHALSPWVAFVIVPLFALANAGVALGGLGPHALAEPLVVAIAAGLFVGKQASDCPLENAGKGARDHAQGPEVHGVPEPVPGDALFFQLPEGFGKGGQFQAMVFAGVRGDDPEGAGGGRHPQPGPRHGPEV